MRGTKPPRHALLAELPRFWERVGDAPSRFLGLDYDGTLAPFAVDPMEARPLPGIADLLRALTVDTATEVAIISGRPAAEVMALLDGPPVTVVGNHGYELCPVDGDPVIRQPTPEQRQGLDNIRAVLQQRGYGRALENKMASLAVHTRGLEPVTAVALEQEVLSEWGAFALDHGLECRWFNGGVEIRCIGWHKGDALRSLLDQQPRGTLAVYVGDDETDEDAFAALEGRGIGIKVGRDARPTAARATLADCAAVADFLRAWRTVTTTHRRNAPWKQPD